jgi:hypothetical protein
MIGIIISWMLLIAAMIVGSWLFVEGSWWLFLRLFRFIDRFVNYPYDPYSRD